MRKIGDDPLQSQIQTFVRTPPSQHILSDALIERDEVPRDRPTLQQIHDLNLRILTIRELDAKQPPLPKGLGTAICEKYAITPSKRIGDIKKELEAACERGALQERQDDAYYLDYIEREKLLERFPG